MTFKHTTFLLMLLYMAQILSEKQPVFVKDLKINGTDLAEKGITGRKTGNVLLKLLEKAWIATPHIAGYSLEGKYNATRIVLDAFADFAGGDNTGDFLLCICRHLCGCRLYFRHL